MSATAFASVSTHAPIPVQSVAAIFCTTTPYENGPLGFAQKGRVATNVAGAVNRKPTMSPSRLPLQLGHVWTWPSSHAPCELRRERTVGSASARETLRRGPGDRTGRLDPLELQGSPVGG
jgi:hypothetical protein